jgi:hypothetical protein
MAVGEAAGGAWLITAALGFPFIVGVPLARWLVQGDDRDDLFWIVAPLLGLAAIILAGQNLVYWNVPVARSTPFIWLAGLALFAASLRRRAWPAVPRSIMMGAALAYAVPASAMLRLGAANYVGYGWIDCFNYTATAQFLMDQPFRTSFGDVGNVPYLFAAVAKKWERIGQGVLQAFVASSGSVNAKTAYGAVSLLSPFLVVLAAAELARRAGLRGWVRAAAALAAGVLPGVAVIHLECFYSQALVLPFLLVWPVLVHRVLTTPRWHAALVAAAAIAAGNAIYTEFTPLFVAVAGVQWAHHAWIHRGRGAASRLLWLTLGLAGAVGLNPWYAGATWTSIVRTATPGVLSHIYPFALDPVGLGRLWFAGIPCRPSVVCGIQGTAGIVLALLGVIGWVMALLRDRASHAAGVLALMAVPVGLGLLGERPYQYYKTVLTVSPLLVVGVWALAHRVAREGPWPRRRAAAYGALTLLLLTSGFATARLAQAAVKGGSRSMVVLVNTPRQRTIYEGLEASSGRRLLLSSAHPMELAWLAYHARRNRSWLINPRLSDLTLREVPGTEAVLDVSRMPRDAEVVRAWEYPWGQAAAEVAIFLDSADGFRGLPGSETVPFTTPIRLYVFTLGGETALSLSFDVAAAGSGPAHETIRLTQSGRGEVCEVPLSGTTHGECRLHLAPGLSLVMAERVVPAGARLAPAVLMRSMRVEPVTDMSEPRAAGRSHDRRGSPRDPSVSSGHAERRW